MTDDIPCRVAACKEADRWCFYLINDAPQPLTAVLTEVAYERRKPGAGLNRTGGVASWNPS